MQRNVALQVAGKVELSSAFRNVARQVAACNLTSATCNAILSKSANQSVSLVMVTAEIYHLIEHVANCEQKFRACDIPSETCNDLQSSLLRCKLQMKLLRVTWPFNTSFLQPAMQQYLALQLVSCKKCRSILFFWWRCETSCCAWHASSVQLASQRY